MNGQNVNYSPVAQDIEGGVQRKHSLQMEMGDLESSNGPTTDANDGESETESLQPASILDKKKFGYEETLIYGKYRKELGSFAKFQAKRQKKMQDKSEFDEEPKPLSRFYICLGWVYRARDWLFQSIGEDWIYLALLGIIMGVLSFVMDVVVEKIHEAKFFLHEELEFSITLQFFFWVLFSLLLILFATGFTHLVSPQAAGSGLPELKTILRGVVLKEYLTFRTFVAKVVGLTCSLGSTLHIGKEGPFVHIASIVVTLLGKLSSFKSIYENESRRTEMLAVACAVGVAGTYAAPIGGVLFSIEVTATYFSVRSYWRGFFSAVCVSVVFRILGIWFQYEDTITTMFKTNLKTDYPFYPIELLAFAMVGIICGALSALFILLHRRIILFTRRHKKMSEFLQNNRFVYPGIATILIASCTFPAGLGQYFAGYLPQKRAIYDLFSNITWTRGQANNLDQAEVLSHWKHPDTNIHVTLLLFVIMQFWMSALTNTLPIPAGVFVPVFTVGAGIGRLFGELMALWFPNGVTNIHDGVHKIVPGGYAVVGAAAFAGGVTRTVSTSVMVFEVTGQISHVIPAVIAVLLANAVANMFQPSFYDSIIRLKKLPFLPSIVSSKVDSWSVCAEEIMVKEVKYISFLSTYKDLKDLLESTFFRTYPLTDSSESMILLGSVKRFELERILWIHLNSDQKVVIPETDRSFSPVQGATPGSSQQSSRAPTPPLSVEFTNDKPKPKTKLMNRFMVLKVDETADKPHKRDHKPPAFTITRSLSAGKLEDMDKPKEGRTRSILKHTSSLKQSPSDSDLDQLAREHFKVLSERQTDSITEDVPFILNKSNIQALAKKVKLPPEPVRVKLLSAAQKKQWEQDQLKEPIDWEGCQIDPAPFQLVERTSLHKVHSMFSLLGLNHAYVTNTGKLVGVVALKEIRKAIQGRIDEHHAKKKQKKEAAQQALIEGSDSSSDSDSDEVFKDEEELEIVESESGDDYKSTNRSNGNVEGSDKNEDENENLEKSALLR